jgi:GT2 family glycosyltransferase
MLIVTLNHNLPNWTDSLVSQLKKDPMFSECELMVIDNGSSEPKAKSTTHELETNVFFGGGINAAVDYFLTTDHEYMYFLNNDLVFHGPSFLTTSLREEKNLMLVFILLLLLMLQWNNVIGNKCGIGVKDCVK